MMARFSDEETASFLLGVPTACQSSNVREATYVEEARTLVIEFHSGGQYSYPGVGFELAEEFAFATSKGQFIWDRFRRRNWPFVKTG